MSDFNRNKINDKNDILFISPSNEKLGGFKRFVPRSIPLGVDVLASYLSKFNLKSEILDEEIVKIDEGLLKAKRRYRSLNNDKTIEDLEFLINNLGQKNITFFDDFFTGDRKRVFELCKMIRERRLYEKCSFGVQTRGDSVDEDLLIEMKKSDFDSLMFGFETSSNHLMKVINKNETVEDNVNAIVLAKKIGFTVEATFILRFPEEKYEDRINALHIAKNIVDRARFNNATPYPGTRFYEIALSGNKLSVQKGWDNFISAGAVTGQHF